MITRFAEKDRYNAVAAGLHWLIAILVFAEIYVGWTFGDMERGAARDLWFDWHKTVGITILILSLARLGWRIANPPPPLPARTPRWERVVAGLSHFGFYVVLIGLPLTGWAAVSTGRAALTSDVMSLVNGLSWPLIPGLPRTLHEPMEGVHELLVKVTYALVVLHVVAALKHQFLDKGRMAGRMWPFPRR
ncbi:MAG: cytochrome b [Brevundimonas sp.]|jgi:cytochrome b561|uniref:cytochrome b n=1 Tax=Brevundimonas sp. TaxID=1871086 RepID=UPI0025B7F001|nr:cytochrome b [Brevundimonas sp.]MCH4267264.1 cytochrome b [Brevundimonas sp.]